MHVIASKSYDIPVHIWILTRGCPPNPDSLSTVFQESTVTERAETDRWTDRLERDVIEATCVQHHSLIVSAHLVVRAHLFYSQGYHDHLLIALALYDKSSGDCH